MRGENLDGWREWGMGDGTSPRARGKPARAYGHGHIGRNIPACAGKTASAQESFCTTEEHPRVRGENNSLCLSLSDKPRNIPACAGKTCSENR